MAEVTDAIDLHGRLKAMRSPVLSGDEEFHAVTLTADRFGRPSITFFTRWVGWHDQRRRVELRQSSVVTARHAEVWRLIGQDCSYVLHPDDLIVFLVAGGNGLVERSLAEQAFPGIADPHPSYLFGSAGFVDVGVLAPGAFNRAPTRKMRASVMARDGRRCRVCGQRPDDDVNVTLHVHHIRPWAQGGVTDPANLVTLCDACHDGLDPHFDRSLFDYVEQDGGDEAFDASVGACRATAFDGAGAKRL